MRHQSHTTSRFVFLCLLLAAALPLMAAAPASGQTNNAVDFDGNNDYITFLAARDLGLAEFTLECWFKREGTGVATSTGTGGVTSAIPLVTKGRGEGESSNIDMNWFLGIDNTTNKLAADFEDSASGANHPIIGTTVLSNNTWYHAAATFDGKRWRLYLDGVLDAESPSDIAFTPRSDSIQHSGIATAMTSTGAAAGFFNGVIDEVRIWSYARSQKEISESRELEISSASGLRGRWGLNEATGTVAANSVSGGVNGTLTNSPAWVTGYTFSTPPTLPPEAPSNLSAAAGNYYTVNLTWTDNAENESRFEIERSQAGGPFSLIAAVAAGAQYFADRGLTSETEYCYRVRASNAAGTSSYSTITCATTPTETGAQALNFAYGTGAAKKPYVTFGVASILGLPKFTIECWFKRQGTSVPTTTGNGGVTSAIPLVTKGRGEAESSNVDMNWFLGIDSTTNKLAADFEDTTNGGNHPVIGISTISNNTWYHAAATYDGTTWRLYLNGSLENQSAANATPRFDSIQHAALATAMNSSGVPDGYFNGIIDEVRIWNYARTQKEISESMNLEVRSAFGLVARFGMNEGSGSAIYNSVSSGISGIMVSWPEWLAGYAFPFPPVQPPAAPSAPAAAAVSSTVVDFTWTDNANSETAFEVQRSLTGISGPFSLHAVLAAGAEAFRDSGLDPETECCYKVRAINAASSSDYTDAVCAETPIAPTYALDFGGSGTNTNTYVTFGNATGLGLSTFTIECWFRRDGTGTSANTGSGGFYAIPLIAKGRGESDGGNVDMNYFLGILESDNLLAADFEDTATGLNHPIVGITPIVTGTWYHAAATYDGNKWQLFLNGSLEGEIPVGATPRFDSLQHAGLATAMNSTGVVEGYFGGAMDEVRIWNYARTQAQVESTINSQIKDAQPGLVARWGLNEGTGTVVNGGAGTTINGTIINTNYAWVAAAPFNINLAPSQPVLVSPTDNAPAVARPPDLTVAVSDPEGQDLTVNFYGRPKPPAAESFTIIALPDTQFYSAEMNGGSAAIFNSQTQWIVNNRASRNIALVTHLGDVVEVAATVSQWQNADAALILLEPLGIPYGIAIGNHDQDPSGNPDGTSNFNTWFGISRFTGRPYYGGYYGTNNDNHYVLVSAGGLDFIVIFMEYDTSPDQVVLDWANTLLQANSDRKGIIVSHNLLSTAANPALFSTQGQAVYDALKANPNLFLMLCGHVSGEGRRTEPRSGMDPVHTLLADYQSRPNGGNGWLRLMEFIVFEGLLQEVRVKTYSPHLDQYETDADSQFTLVFENPADDFELIGTAGSVASGANASVAWPGLNALVEYEWYVTVTDGAKTTTGPICSFSTTGILGDINGDCDVDGSDLAAFINALSVYNPKADIEPIGGDGDVDANDLYEFTFDFGTVGCP